MRTIGELLIALKGAKNDDEKVELLTSNKDLPKLAQYVELLTNPEIEFWSLPDGVSYKTRDHVLGRTTTLMSSYKTFGYMKLPTRVREDRLRDMFVGMMDVLHISEAELAACIVERKELPFVSNKILRNVFDLSPVATTAEAEAIQEKVAEKEVEDVSNEFNVVVTEAVNNDPNEISEVSVPQVALSKPVEAPVEEVVPTLTLKKSTPKKSTPKKSTPKKTPRKTTKKK